MADTNDCPNTTYGGGVLRRATYGGDTGFCRLIKGGECPAACTKYSRDGKLFCRAKAGTATQRVILKRAYAAQGVPVSVIHATSGKGGKKLMVLVGNDDSDDDDVLVVNPGVTTLKSIAMVGDATATSLPVAEAALTTIARKAATEAYKFVVLAPVVGKAAAGADPYTKYVLVVRKDTTSAQLLNKFKSQHPGINFDGLYVWNGKSDASKLLTPVGNYDINELPVALLAHISGIDVVYPAVSDSARLSAFTKPRHPKLSVHVEKEFNTVATLF
jgi:hypothetical protein